MVEGSGSMIYRFVRRLFRSGEVTKPERYADTVLDESGSEVPKATIHGAAIIKEERHSWAQTKKSMR